MDVLRRLEELGARGFAADGSHSLQDIELVEQRLDTKLPRALKVALKHFGAPICFDKEVELRPLERSGWESEDGSLDINIVYGPVEGSCGILSINDDLSSQVPRNCVVIAGSSGGNQICIDRETDTVLFWDHEAVDDARSTFLVAKDFSEFLKSLYVVDDTGPLLKEGDVASVNLRF